MDHDVVRACARASAEGRLSFGDVIGKLIAAGVERYHADFMRGETAYFAADGAFEVVALDVAHGAAAADFRADEIEAAVRASQAGAINYPVFCERALSAGCVGYHVSMAGKRVVYYGRTGEAHVEWFPGAR